MPHATQSGLRRDAAVHLQCTGHVAYRSPAPLTPLRNPTVVPGYSARPNQNAGDGSSCWTLHVYVSARGGMLGWRKPRVLFI